MHKKKAIYAYEDRYVPDTIYESIKWLKERANEIDDINYLKELIKMMPSDAD